MACLVVLDSSAAVAGDPLEVVRVLPRSVLVDELEPEPAAAAAAAAGLDELEGLDMELGLKAAARARRLAAAWA